MLQAVQLGQKYDDSLKIAEKGVDDGRVQQRIARSSLLPQVSAATSVRHSENFDEQRAVNESLSLTQTIWNAQQHSLHAASKKRLELASTEHAKAISANLLNVTEAYLGVLSAASNLELANRNVAGVESHKKVVETLFGLRESTILEILETLADLDLAILSVISADNNLSNSQERLGLLIGEGEHDLVSVNIDLSSIGNEVGRPLAEWLESAEHNNHDLRISRLRLAIAEINIEQARRDKHPRVSFRGAYDRSRTHGGLASGNGDITRQATLSLDLPLYQGGRRAAKLKEAQIAYDRQQLRIAQQTKQLRQQITALYRKRRNARERAFALISLVDSNRRKIGATQDGFARGDRTSSEVLTAQNLLLESETDLVSSIHDYILSGLELENSAGALSIEDIH
ncbi:MAG: TolC family protein, partial [bacterium]